MVTPFGGVTPKWGDYESGRLQSWVTPKQAGVTPKQAGVTPKRSGVTPKRGDSEAGQL
jgi:hypothetical protein